MSLSNRTKDEEVKDIRALGIFTGDTSREYKGNFYNHLMLLLKPKFVDQNNLDRLRLNVDSYLCLEQICLEYSGKFEIEPAREIDWERITDVREIFEEELTATLIRKGYKEDKYNRLIGFTIDIYENFKIYDQMYPGSSLNPWFPVHNILNAGHLLGISDEREVLDGYNKKIYGLKFVEETNNQNFENLSMLGVISKEVKPNGQLTGFMVDNRHTSQAILFNYLRTDAVGRGNAKNINHISNHLLSKGKSVHDYAIKNYLLLPLKRAGIIGSTNAGYYYLSDQDDFIATFRSHKDKIRAIESTLSQYRASYKEKFEGASLDGDAGY